MSHVTRQHDGGVELVLDAVGDQVHGEADVGLLLLVGDPFPAAAKALRRLLLEATQNHGDAALAFKSTQEDSLAGLRRRVVPHGRGEVQD